MARTHKEPTCTSKVLAALRAQDDFMDYRALEHATGLKVTQVSAACYSLLRYRAIGVEIVNGRGWWYPLPPEEDTRYRVFDERTPESKPRTIKRPRKGIKHKHRF